MRDAYRTHSAFFRLPVLFFLLSLFFAGTAGHAAAAAAPAAPKNSTRIVSEKMTYDAKKNQVVFEGKVHVTRPTMEIWSELLTVVMDESGKKAAPAGSAGALGVGGGKVDKIIAERNVRIKQDNKLGTSSRATYFVNEGRIVMEGNPVIVDGDNRISGKVITYYTETGRSLVTGAPDKPVEVLFTTDDNKASPDLPGVGVGETPPAANGTGTTGGTRQ